MALVLISSILNEFMFLYRSYLVEQRGNTLGVRGASVPLRWFRVKRTQSVDLMLMYVSELATEALMHLMMLLAANMEGLLAVVMADECLGSSLDCCLNTSLL